VELCAELLAENERLRGENGRLRVRCVRLTARVSELVGKLEELRRAAKRQAAPFSRGKRKENCNKERSPGGPRGWMPVSRTGSLHTASAAAPANPVISQPASAPDERAAPRRAAQRLACAPLWGGGGVPPFRVCKDPPAGGPQCPARVELGRRLPASGTPHSDQAGRRSPAPRSWPAMRAKTRAGPESFVRPFGRPNLGPA
jgi:hypothetical protein